VTRPLAFAAATLVSAMGRGLDATRQALEEERSGLRPCDFVDVALEAFVGRVAGIEDVRLPAALQRFDCRNNRLAQLALETDGFAAAVAAAKARHGAQRIAVILGTSTSGILESEDAYRRRDASGALPADFDYAHTHDLFSLAGYVRAALGLAGPALVISTACSSSAKAFATAADYIAAGLCDAAVVGGTDTLCRTTLYGFRALELLSREPCRPFDAARDGISIGEAAGFVLLEPAAGASRGAVALLGCGASSDAHHMSSPHPEGKGAILAMRGALHNAGLAPRDIDYVNFHGTGTRANDAMEDRAVAAVFGSEIPCSSTKGWSGHTLGAAGVLEAIISALAITHGLVPASLNLRRRDPELQSRVVAATERRDIRRVVSNSFGFGGSNCSLVLGRLP